MLAFAATEEAAADEIDPQALARRPLGQWIQAERKFGFARWARLYPARLIARGPSVHVLSQGAPLAGFAPGGTGALLLQRSVDDAKLAGIVVLRLGRVRQEH